MRGITILVDAGDFGALSSEGTDICLTPEGKGGGPLPSLANASPYVTVVGGTMPADGFPGASSAERVWGIQGTVARPETLQTNYPGHPAGMSSGGGFSNWFPMPQWQKKAVEAYFATRPATEGYPMPGTGFNQYNNSGRGYPGVRSAIVCDADGARAPLACTGTGARRARSTPAFTAGICRYLGPGRQLLHQRVV